MKITLTAALLMLATPPALAEPITGHAYISDGDTVEIGTTRIRLAGIDAPETDQVCLDAKGEEWACGHAASRALIAYSGNRDWTCDLQARPDRYGRRVGTCSVGGVDVQHWMVREGWALDYRRYSHGAYGTDEDAARGACRGLWSGSFHAPWDWRHRTCQTEVLGCRSVPVDAAKRLCEDR